MKFVFNVFFFVNIDGFLVESSNCRKLIGNTIDSHFTFKKHINTLRQKSKVKLLLLSKIIQYLTQKKRA